MDGSLGIANLDRMGSGDSDFRHQREHAELKGALQSIRIGMELLDEKTAGALINEHISDLEKTAERSNQLTAGLGYGFMVIVASQTIDLVSRGWAKLSIGFLVVSVTCFFVQQISSSVFIHHRLVRAAIKARDRVRVEGAVKVWDDMCAEETQLRSGAAYVWISWSWETMYWVAVVTGVASPIAWVIGLASDRA